MLRGTRYRAKKLGIVFDLKPEDIVVPEFCPVLGMRLEPGNGLSASSPSLDRFDPTKGYTKENVRVISARANTLKSNATADELRLVLDYVTGTS